MKGRPAPDLPTELWLKIAEYLSTGNVTNDCRGPIPRELMGVNRTFYTLYMQAQYGEVRWNRVDKSMMVLLRRLQCVVPSLVFNHPLQLFSIPRHL